MSDFPTFPKRATLGTRLRGIRHYRGLTLTQLKDEADVAVGTLSDIENNHRTPNTTTLLKLSKALQVSLNQLTGA